MLRTMLGAALVLLPATAMPGTASAQDAPDLEHVFTIIAEIADAVELGETTRGTRRLIPITGGLVRGEGISGTVRAGAWDWQIDRPDGCTELEADYFIQTDDSALINVVNNAVICPPEDGASRPPVFTSPKFEPPLGRYQWLGRGVYIGRLALAEDHPVPAVQIEVFRVR